MGAISAVPLHCRKWEVILWCFLIVFPHFTHWSKISHGILLNGQLALALGMPGFHNMDMMDFCPGPSPLVSSDARSVLLTRVGETDNRDCPVLPCYSQPLPHHGWCFFPWQVQRWKPHVPWDIWPSPPTIWKDKYPSISTSTIIELLSHQNNFVFYPFTVDCGQ